MAGSGTADPKPKNETAGKLRAGNWMWSSGRKRRRTTNAEERAQRRADRVCVAASGSGQKVGEICREMGVSAQAFYRWKRRFAGIGLSGIRELRQLREENRKLKTLVADLTWDKHILQEVLSKKR
jgi:putative transposase